MTFGPLAVTATAQNRGMIHPAPTRQTHHPASTRSEAVTVTVSPLEGRATFSPAGLRRCRAAAEGVQTTVRLVVVNPSGHAPRHDGARF